MCDPPECRHPLSAVYLSPISAVLSSPLLSEHLIYDIINP